MPTRSDAERGRVLRFERLDVIIALGLAGLVNMAMLAVAAKLFFDRPGYSHLSTIQQAHSGLTHLVGGTAALAFAVALLASGASSSVGTYAGQVVMAGFVNLRISLLLRRAITMIPALVILALGVSPTNALVFSQVVLSFGIPFALIPLVHLTSRHDLMGSHVNRRTTTSIAVVIVSVISLSTSSCSTRHSAAANPQSAPTCSRHTSRTDRFAAHPCQHDLQLLLRRPAAVLPLLAQPNLLVGRAAHAEPDT